MKRPILLAAVITLAALVGCAAVAIEDSQVSLRKASVFGVVEPVPFSFDGPGAAVTIEPLPGSGMPPMINHPVDEYLPLTLKSNECLDCHDKPRNIGKPVAAGKAPPAPASHYLMSVGAEPKLAGKQFNCMACHAPQADVSPLVVNRSR
jgi:nitrate reductase cytochrome c-type subunit